MILYVFRRLFSTAILSLTLCAFISGQNQNVSQGIVFDGEPYLVVNPNDQQHLVVAWMGFKLNEKIVIKTKYSNDGGSTWSAMVSLPHMVSGNTSADPSLQFDENGDVFVCYIDYDATTFTNGAIYVSKSEDGGSSWNTPVDAINLSDCPNKYCIDRPWMEIDRTSGPNQGSIYVTSMNADQNVSPPYNPYLAVSTDGGNSFQTPRFLDTTGFLAGSAIPQPMPSPAIGTDGTFYAAYPSYVLSQNILPAIIMASSQNGGGSLDHKVIRTGGLGTGVSNEFAKKASYFFSDESDSDHLAMVVLAEYNGDPDLFYFESYDKGLNWSGLTRVNQDPISNGVLQDMIWADFNANGDLVITWRDRRNSGDTSYSVPTEIYAAVRMSGDTSFKEITVSDQVVSHDTILEESGNDFMCVELIGDTMYVVWGDVRTSRLNIWMSKVNIQDAVGLSTIIHDVDLIRAYPNPSSDFVHIDDAENESYVLLNDRGEKVKRGIYHERIDLRDLSPAYYFLYFKNPNLGMARILVE